MSIGRRRFIRSASAGSAALLAGCTSGPGPAPTGDGGTACPTPRDIPPPVLEYPPPAYFDQLSSDLDAATIGTPVALIDLDRMEANIDEIVARIGPTNTFRIVEKSLPSIDLLRRVSERAGTTSFLVLHLPLLGELLAAFPDADVIVGKTHLTSAVQRFWDDLPAGSDGAAIAARVVFLADSPERLAELAALAGTLGVTLRIAVEIDVGLRRSGVRVPAELGAVLEGFGPTAPVQLAGLLGYDGHVAFAPGGRDAVMGWWEDATAAYRAFIEVLTSGYPDLVRPDLIFHSGGTSTFSLYDDPTRTPVNDVATGGGVLRPGEYPDYFLGGLAPAVFIATPVLRTYDVPAIPFLDDDQNRRVFGGRQGFTIYGGGWPASFTYPPISGPPLSGSCAGYAWVPNQGLATAAPEVDISVGDWIYFHPSGSDVLFQFETIHLVRGGRLTGETMRAYPRRY